MARTPIATYGIIIFCAAIYLWQTTLGPIGEMNLILDYGLVPNRLLGRLPEVESGVDWLVLATPVTSIFLHTGWVHLFFNMACVFFFGRTLEQTMGTLRLILFFVITGAAGGLVHAVLTVEPEAPMIGASGAVFGLFGGFLLLAPKVRVIPFLLPIPIPFYVLIAVVMVFHAVVVVTGWLSGIAWWAHIGGFAAGAALYPLMRYRGVPLFQDLK